MSNHGDPWRKFVQTFFLAEQPNGYFVLNDIFRFLKEETLEGEGMDDIPDEPATVPEPVPVAQNVVSAPEPTYEPPREPTPPPPTTVEDPAVAASVVADEAPTTDTPELHVTQTPSPAPEEHAPPPVTPPVQPNGIHIQEEKQAVAPVEPSPVPTPAPAPIQSTPAHTTNPAPTPATAPPVSQTQPPAQASAPTPTAPQAPRSWASLAASNPKGWGSAVSQGSRGTTEILSSNAAPTTNGIPTQVVQPAAAPNAAPQHHQNHHQHQRGPHGGANHHGPQALLAAQSVTHAHCFVKVSCYSFLFFPSLTHSLPSLIL